MRHTYKHTVGKEEGNKGSSRRPMVVLYGRWEVDRARVGASSAVGARGGAGAGHPRVMRRLQLVGGAGWAEEDRDRC